MLFGSWKPPLHGGAVSEPPALFMGKSDPCGDIQSDIGPDFGV